MKSFLSIIKRVINYFIRLVLRLLPELLFPKINVILFNYLGYKIDSSSRVSSSVEISGFIDVSIGKNTYVGPRTIISGGEASIFIGSMCDISGNVGIICGTHEINKSGPRIAGKGIGKNITIGNGVWIGFGALILPGVEIGDKCIVGAGCVVSKNITSGSIATGNPMVIKKIY